MNRKAVSPTMLTLLLIGMLTWTFNIQPVRAESATIIVPDDYKKIQWAIGNASAGDTIYARAGIYSEHVTINKNHLTLVGENRENTMINGEGGTGFYVEADNVTIKEFTIENGDYGVVLELSWEYYSNRTVSRNNIINNSCGIYCAHSRYNNISGNKIKNNGRGIYFRNGTWHNTVSGNNITNNDDCGVELGMGSTAHIYENNITNNGCGVVLWHDSHADISANNITNNDGYGIEFLDSSSGIISQNNVTNNSGHGIYFETSWGSVSGNNIANNDGCGLRLLGLFYGGLIVSRNDIANNQVGIHLQASSYNTIFGNIVANNGEGITLKYHSINNTVSGNNVTNNVYGIHLYNSSENLFYHNNFINNTNQAYDDTPSSNDWNHPTILEGNYWSDYAGRDDGSGVGKHAIASDGIGDTLIPHPDVNYDFYPLMNPYPFFDSIPPAIYILSPQNTTYTEGSVPLTFTVNEKTSWIGYSLDDQENVTITGNIPLTGLPEGSHNIVVYANDTSGNMGASDTVHFTVALPYGPEAKLTAAPETADVGELVKFDASASSPGWNGTHEMSITEYRWNFGDGNKTTTSTPIVYHSFSNSGIYYVTLTVYASGATPETDSTTHKVTVRAIPVGGYSFPIKGYTTEKPLATYLGLLAILTISFTVIERKTCRRTKR